MIELKEAQIQEEEKLYLITHSELPLQYQVPQTTHAAIQFANEYPEAQKKWFEQSNSIITLSAKDERSLWNFTKLLDKKGVKYSKFFEPDIGYSLTAIALVPGQNNKKICCGLPLAGKYNNPKTQERLEKTFEIIDAMNACEQTNGQTILQHGLSVRNRLMELTKFLREESPLVSDWKLPDWCLKYRKRLSTALHDDYTLEKYAIFHDCGKPFCKIFDADGRQHFPNHAEKSAEIWATISDDKLIQKLIQADMDIHTLSAAGIDNFLHIHKENAITLLIAGLAEIHANAGMFGDSTNFKIKWKHIDRRGWAICKKLFGV